MSRGDDIKEMLRFGSVSYSDWAGYAWKNELHEQRNRVLLHFRELIEELETDHNPHHMLERAFSVSAFCMRRLIECRLVTDRFRDSDLPIFEIARKPGEWPETRDPFLCSTGGNFFDNFNMKNRSRVSRKPKLVADKFLHARFVALLSGSEYLPDGLLVASDHQAKHSLFHMTIEDYDEIVHAFLGDQVKLKKDWVDIETGKVHAIRE